MEQIREKARTLDVRETYDVVVAGGGVAGISAALAARRMGKRVLLIEREYMLGGLATLGLVTIYLPLCDGEGRYVSRGIASELLMLSVSEGAEEPLPEPWQAYIGEGRRVTRDRRREKRAQCRFNAAMFAILAEKKLLAEGVDILYGTLVADATVTRGKITYLTLENKSGRYAVAVGSVVDATGDADVVRVSGGKYGTFTQGNVLAAWYYAGEDGKPNQLRLLGASDIPDDEKRAQGIDPANSTCRRFSGLDGAELSEQVTLSHATLLEDFLKKGKISPTHTLNAAATIPQIRMTRRIEGPLVMGADTAHREFPDSVGLFTDWRKRGPVFELPFRTLYSVNIRNLIAAGRNISVCDALWDVTRVIPVCAVSGEAAGTAAAMTDNFAHLSVRRLQTVLRRGGVLLHERQLPRS